MGRKSRFSTDIKAKAVEDYLNGKSGLSRILVKLDIHKSSFYEWVRKYNLQGRVV